MNRNDAILRITFLYYSKIEDVETKKAAPLGGYVLTFILQVRILA
jgi:hypothetical protein